jgi:hypothetical protein
MAVEVLVLRVIHILCGLFWVGAGLFSTFYLAPALKEAGPAAAGAVMASLQRRRMLQVMPAVAVLTILSGARLMWIVSAGNPHWFQHRAGHTYAISAALAIIALLTGVFYVRPTMMRVGKLSHSAASDGASKERIAAEVATLQKRVAMASGAATLFLVLAATGMAIARYL